MIVTRLALTERVSVHMTTQDRQALEVAAKGAGVSPATWSLRAIRAQLRRR